MAGPVQIQLARRADAVPMAQMSRDLIETGLGWKWRHERILRSMRDPETAVIKACVGDRLIGFAIMRFGMEEAHLDLLAVLPGYHRLGVATSLLAWLETSARTAGVSVIRLELRETNLGARRFYQRCGYMRVRTVRGYYAGRESAVQMARDLWLDESVGLA